MEIVSSLPLTNMDVLVALKRMNSSYHVCWCLSVFWKCLNICPCLQFKAQSDLRGRICWSKSMRQSNLCKTFTHSLSAHDRTYPDSQICRRLNNVEVDSCQAVGISCSQLSLNVTFRWHINHYIYIFCRSFIRVDNFNLSSEKKTALLFFFSTFVLNLFCKTKLIPSLQTMLSAWSIHIYVWLIFLFFVEKGNFIEEWK